MRAARSTDVFRLTELLVEAHAQSRFAGLVDVDEPHCRKTMAQLIQRHGGKHEGGTCCYVVDDADGTVHAFMIGILDRVYHIGTKLVANDLFLIAGSDAPATAMSSLIDAYLDWADTNPNVHEVVLSSTDALPSGARMAAVYERKGFQRSGDIFRRDRASIFERIAA